MKRCLIAVFLFVFAALLFAQADRYPGNDTSGGFDYLGLRKGDQTIRLSLGVNVPILMHGGERVPYYPSNIYVGGGGNIGYNYHIARGFSVGADINFQFNTTLAGNVLFKLPILIRPAYTFRIWRIHIPVSIGVGATFESYDGSFYFNFSLQPEVAAYYIINSEWSLGIALSWDFLPQWYEDSSYTRYGHFLNTHVSLRYHF